MEDLGSSSACESQKEVISQSSPDSSHQNVQTSDSADYAFDMKQCAEALKETSEADAVVESALRDDADGSSEEEGYAEAKDSVDSDVEYDDEYLKELYVKLPEADLLALKEQANDLKNEGNELYRNRNFKEAIKVYTQALNKCPLQFTSERSILFANRAAVKVSLEDKEAAVADCNKALELNPKYLKALIRRAQLYRKLDELEKSFEDYKKIFEVDPDNREARQACATLPGEINEKNEKLKKEMLSKLKDLGNMVLKPFGMSTDNFNVVQDPKSGGYSVNFQR